MARRILPTVAALLTLLLAVGQADWPGRRGPDTARAPIDLTFAESEYVFRAHYTRDGRAVLVWLANVPDWLAPMHRTGNRPLRLLLLDAKTRRQLPAPAAVVPPPEGESWFAGGVDLRGWPRGHPGLGAVTDLTTGVTTPGPIPPRDQTHTGVTFAAGGARCAYGVEEGEVVGGRRGHSLRVIDRTADGWRLLVTFPPRAGRQLGAVAFAPDGTALAWVAGAAGRPTLACHSLPDGRQRWETPADGGDMCFTPDGRYLLTRSSGRLVVHDARTGRQTTQVDGDSARADRAAYADGVLLTAHRAAERHELVWRDLASGGEERRLRTAEPAWSELGSESRLKTWLGSSRLAVVTVRYRPAADGKELPVLVAQVYDPTRADPVASHDLVLDTVPYRPELGTMSNVVVSPDGRFMAAYSWYGRRLRLFGLPD